MELRHEFRRELVKGMSRVSQSRKENQRRSAASPVNHFKRNAGGNRNHLNLRFSQPRCAFRDALKFKRRVGFSLCPCSSDPSAVLAQLAVIAVPEYRKIQFSVAPGDCACAEMIWAVVNRDEIRLKLASAVFRHVQDGSAWML